MDMDNTSSVEATKQHVNQQLSAKFSVPSVINAFNVNLEPALDIYRKACLDAILTDLASSKLPTSDICLWEMHTKVRARFAYVLSKLEPTARQAPSKDYQKTGKEFLLFIKASQTAYNTLLRAVNKQCDDICILQNIASSYNKDHNDTSAPSNRSKCQPPTPAETRASALKVTRDSLIYLGDLSRWRHKAHLDRATTPGWKKAREYYGLAYEVDPASGLSKHQLAVLAQEDGKYFPALSSLYQSLASEQPHPQASSNLDVLMKRLAIPINQLIPKVRPSRDHNNAVATLRAWFLQLHVLFFEGKPFDKHLEMESEVLVRLGQALKDDTSLGGTLLNMIFIDMAAEFVAVGQAQQDTNPTRAAKRAQTYFFCFQHNIKTFRVLLNHLHDHLEAQARESVTTDGQISKLPPIRSVALQAVRLFALWFGRNWSFMQKCMEANTPDHAVAEDVRELWRLYAHVSNVIYEQYELHQAPSVADCKFLVEEEEITMGFLPIQHQSNEDVWRRNGEWKLVSRQEHDPEQQLTQQLVRLRDIFSRALMVAQDASSSFILAGNKIIFNESGTTSELFSPPPAHEGEPLTPPPAGHQVDPVLFGGPMAEENQDLWHSGASGVHVAVPTYDQASKSIQGSRSAKLLVEGEISTMAARSHASHEQPYDFPKQLPWVNEFLQDAIWKNDDTSNLLRTPWSGQPFFPAWYNS